jgi:prepilin-type N-terminal cleavage/methylation domain-containing protein
VRRPAAFTLIEVLLTLALLALVSSVLISGTANFFRLRESRPDEDFWRAVAAARSQALSAEQTVTMHYDDTAHRLAWAWDGGGASAGLQGDALRFLPGERTGAKLLGGIITETDALPRVRFYPDGTCDAFRAELTAPDGRTSILQIDPWTCAPVLPAAAP